MSTMHPVSKLVRRLDGWFNVLTGLGVKNRDKRVSAAITWCPIGEQDADHIYAQSDIARKIVDMVPDEAMKKGFNISGIDKEQASRILKKFEELGIERAFNDAWKKARQYGGAS